MEIVIFIILHWYFSLFTQTFFLHRYGSHNMFTMSRFWEKVFFVLTLIAQGPSFLNPRAYAILHRQHHTYTDTENDPHSPMYTGNVFRMRWRTFRIYHAVYKGNLTDIQREFDQNTPEWRVFEKIAPSIVVIALFALGYVSFYLHFATATWQYFLLPIHFMMGVSSSSTR